MPEMFVLPFRPAYDSNGRFAPGAQAWFTASETNTPVAVWVDEAMSIPHANPLVADGLGKFPRAYLTPDYRISRQDLHRGRDRRHRRPDPRPRL